MYSFNKVTEDAHTVVAVLLQLSCFFLPFSSLAQTPELKTGIIEDKQALYQPENSTLSRFEAYRGLQTKSQIEQFLYPTLSSQFASNTQKQYAQSSNVNWKTFSLISGGLAVSYTGIYLHIQDRWWGGPKVPFHYNEQYYAKGFDKLGHFYASKMHAQAIARLYELSGVSKNSATLLGAGLSLSIQTMIELKDGWIEPGFDRYDQLSNIAGITWFYAREKINFLQRFNIRWMYYPSETRHRQPAYQTKKLTDYNGQSYWVSMKIWDLLPSEIQPFWPRFLMPSFGVSLNDWPSTVNTPSDISYHLGLSLDFKEIIPQRSGFGRLVTGIFNGIQLPAPALELHPNPTIKFIFYGQD